MLQLAAELGSFLNCTDITKEDLEALLEGFGLSEGEAQTFVRQALDLLSEFGAIQEKANAMIQRKVLQWSVSGANVETVLQQVEALLGQVQQLIKPDNVSTADVQAIVQQLLGFSPGLNTSVADVEVATNATVEDWLNSVNISDANMMAALNQLMGLFNTLGISNADIEFTLEVVIDFISSIDIRDVPTLIAEVHSLLVEIGIPQCGIQRLTLYLLNVFA